MPINENGFLGNEIEKISVEIENKHYEYFDLLRKLNKFISKIRERIEINNRDVAKLVSVCLFIRIHESIQAVAIMLKFGLIADARVVLRSVIEAMFHIKILSEDEQYIEKYLKRDELQRLKKISKMIESDNPHFRDYVNSYSEEQIESIRQNIMSLKKYYFTFERLAEMAGMHDWYDTIYSVLSDTVHISGRGYENYLVFDNSGENVRSFIYGPRDDEEIKDLLIPTLMVALTMLKSADSIFSFNIQDELENFYKKYEDLAKRRLFERDKV